MSAHIPGPWFCGDDIKRYSMRVFARDSAGFALCVASCDEQWARHNSANARLIAAAPDLLALAHQYANECGECAGTRVCPDDEPCTECSDVWAVIDQAEGRA